VPAEAPKGRRLNLIGAYFTYGPEAGRFEGATWAKVPLPERRADGEYRVPLAVVAAKHGWAKRTWGPSTAKPSWRSSGRSPADLWNRPPGGSGSDR
jgi:hypothetical protein